MTLMWAALCAEALVLFAIFGTLTRAVRNRLREGIASMPAVGGMTGSAAIAEPASVAVSE